MIDPMLLPPNFADFRWAVYCRAHLLDLPGEPSQPDGVYRDEESARLYGLRMWPATFTVVDLHKDDRP